VETDDFLDSAETGEGEACLALLTLHFTPDSLSVALMVVQVNSWIKR
jgi:hypothetical protein